MGVRGHRTLARGLIGAILPVQCAGCRAWDEVLCPSCRRLAQVEPVPTIIEGTRGDLPALAMGDYAGPLRRIVLTAKHSERTDVTDFLDEAGARLGTAVARVLGVAGSPAAAGGSREGRAPVGGGAVDVWVVPAPSSWKRRLRGRQVALPLARAVARALAASARVGVRVRVVDAVRLRIGASSTATTTAPRGGTASARIAPIRPTVRCADPALSHDVRHRLGYDVTTDFR